MLSAIAKLRAGGCARNPGTTARLRPVARLDQVARRIAQGTPGDQAAKAAGYRATQMLTISMRGHGSTAAVVRELAKTYCKQILDPQWTEVGVHAQGGSWWLVFAAPFTPPPESATAVVSAEVLALVNEVRSQPRVCGRQRFEAAGPLRPNSLLDHAAAAHARDMARHGYLEHRGRDGSGPADRAIRAGYRWRSVAENIASGQTTAEEVVRQWTRSPGHCANLMNAD
ncbi:MAG: CAP domain-containing protein, partial [Ramlibacter sp.]